jgi:hypothetical protein
MNIIMKITHQCFPRRRKTFWRIQQALILFLAISPTFIFGYNPPSGQRTPRAPGGGSAFLPMEIGEISPLSL